MNVEAVTTLVEREVYRLTNKPLNDLQQAIITKVWQGKKYSEIADEYGCTEGHAKDTASLLWQLLSQAWASKITKSNFRSSIARRFQLGSIETVKHSIKSAASLENTDFIGRETAIADLENLVSRGRKIIVLQGEGGVGKTTLARQFLAGQNLDLVLEVLMAKETTNIVSAAAVVEEWLQRDLNEDSGRELGITLSRLQRCLSQQRIGILIDNLEPALDRDGKLILAHRDYIELLRILADSRVHSLTLITSRDRLYEAEIDLEHYRLSGLDLTAWQSYFGAHQIKGREIAQIQRIYGGNAKAMRLICGVVREDYDGALDRYCQQQGELGIEIDLKNLVASQFDRLQKLDIWAYRLLCRLGCYRYQDLARVSLAGLQCLLWDVPTKQIVIKSLRNRSLLEFAEGEYWLHPIVRAEAITRLQSTTEWEQTQRQIANFLTHSVMRIDNIQAGITALEAYYHYLAVRDYTAAAKVILHSRENQWRQFLTLGTTLFRLGIIQPLATAIEHIIEYVGDRHRSELNNILGDLYWTTGQIQRAIACQQQTLATSSKCWQAIPRTLENRHDLYYWRMLEVDSLLSLGLYNIDLWELARATDLFQQVIALAHQTKHHAWAEKASLGLALVNSYQDSSSREPTVSRLYRLIVDLEDPTYNTGRFAYFMQMLGQILFNYRQIEPARIMWEKAIAFSQSSHYTQIEAKSLLGWGKIARQAANFEQANLYHQQAVEQLTKITARCDLAEAYYQWGVTLQQAGQIIKSRDCWHTAIALYHQIDAPRQVARVNHHLQPGSFHSY